MTQDDFNDLHPGDVIMSMKTGVIYVIVEGYARLLEQKTKDEVKNHREKYKIVYKATS